MPGHIISFDRDLILVVDDDKEFTESVVAMLGKEIPGAKLLKAYDGNRALEAYESSNPRPAIIILDMMLPKRSGFLVLEKINRTSPARPLPHVIMVTANEGARHKAYAETLGVFRYIRKPFEMPVLLQAVQEARGEKKMKATIGALFNALKIVSSELSQLSQSEMSEDARKKEWRRLSEIEMILDKTLKDCPLEVELYPELDHILIPFFEEYDLEITR